MATSTRWVRRRLARLRKRVARAIPAGAFLPVLLVSCAITGLLMFQATQLYKERSELAALRAGQRPAYQEARRLREQLEGMAAAAATLAKQGNSNAIMIVEALRARGFTIDPSKR
jgi:hypothetical protein